MFSKEILKGIDLKSLLIRPEDTVFVTVDPEIWDAEMAQELYNTITKALPPTNAVIVTLKGMDINLQEK